MADVQASEPTASGQDLTKWLTVWMRSTDASSADVMRLVSALNESWVHVLTNAQESEARFRQTVLTARSPSEAAAAYGSWCLAVAGAAMQENQRLLHTGMAVLAERAKRALSPLDSPTVGPSAEPTPPNKADRA
jgi:hypothetical protein